jgi:2-oxoacid:acceptor oxidoreductase gamma subunit (pyruvate/2-ketoisovalerate family)
MHDSNSHPGSIVRYKGKDLIMRDALQSIGVGLYEIRFHGRGGQGAVVASEVLANAAFREGYHVTAFPFFGVERRGAPVTAFARLSKEPILIRSGIYAPDYVIVLDESLLSAVNVLEGLKPGGSLLVNTRHRPDEVPVDSDHKKFTVDATGIAVKYGLGSMTAPIVNTAILGAFAKVSKLVTLNTIIESVRAIVPAKKDANAAATKEAYELVKGG